jgi:SAM-dependent methyltransferase
MTVNLPRPEDYIVDYSPLQDAELFIWVVNERPQSKLTLRSLVRRTREAAYRILEGNRDPNDIAAEQAWQIIQKKWKTLTPETIAQFLVEKFTPTDPLRKFEYPFLARCLARSDVSKNIIVDMGGGHSYSTVVPMLFRYPNTRILSIDVVNHSRMSRYNVEYVTGDCIQTNLPEQSADVVALISTLEHVGLGRWGDPLDVEGDIKAMREAWRILKPGGHVVLTIPYGFPTVVYNLHRVYDAGRVSILTKGFNIVLSEYSLLGKPATQEQIEGARLVAEFPGYNKTLPPQNGVTAPDVPGGAMYLLQKTEQK